MTEVLRRNAAARVHETDNDVGLLQIGANAKDTTALHRFEAVLNDVVKGLLHLIAIQLQQGEVGAKFLLYHHIAVFDLGSEKPNRFFDDGVHICRLKLRPGRANGLKKLANDRVESRNLCPGDGD